MCAQRDSGTSEKEVKANELQQLFQQQELQPREQQTSSSSSQGVSDSGAIAAVPPISEGDDATSLTFKDEFAPPESSVGSAPDEQLPDFAAQRSDSQGF